MDYSYLNDILILFAAAVIVVVICLRLHLPPILGYLAIGVSMGPYGFAVIDDAEHTRAFAEFGVVLLLFTIGLEFSLPLLIRMKGAVLGLGGLQVLVTTMVTVLVSLIVGLPIEAAVILGGVVAMSSTALVTKQLADQVELHSRHGRNSVGILLFQDIMVIPFLVLIASLAAGSTDKSPLVYIMIALGQGFIALAIILAIGRWVLRPLLSGVAHYRSTELFTLTALLVTLGAAWLTNQMGLSLALGAFIAGMMLGETEFRHQVEAEIRPFRDILLGLFFITVGMLLNIQLLPQIWVEVLLILGMIVLIKMLLVVIVCRIAGWNSAISLRTGLVLAHGGEFGFVILALALSGNVIDPEHGQIILAALLISMAMAPILIRFNGRIASMLIPSAYIMSITKVKDQVRDAAHGISNHVIICGYGRVGRIVAQSLKEEGINYIGLDLDPALVKNAVGSQEPVSYGDAANIHILKAAGLANASALLVCINDESSVFKILHKVRHINAAIPILVRANDDSQLERLQQAGATEVIPETLEASLMLSSQLLLMLNIPAERVFQKSRLIRNDRYQLLRSVHPYHTNDNSSLIIDSECQLRMIKINEETWAENKTIKDLGSCGLDITVATILRQNRIVPVLDKNIQIKNGDILILFGAEEQLIQAEDQLLGKV